MIVLDTNVISELMRPLPHAGVMAWVAAQPRDVLYTTSITRAELLYGVAAMPEGKRRETLSALVEEIAPSYGDDWWFAAFASIWYQEIDQFDRARQLAMRSLELFAREVMPKLRA